MKKTPLVFGLLLLLCSVYVVAEYTVIYNPHTGKPDFVRDTFWNTSNYSFSIVGNITALRFIGNLSWTNLTDYPASCPTFSAITALGDSTTCTDGLYTRSNMSAALGNWSYDKLSGNSSNFSILSPGGSCWMKFTNGLMTTTNCSANN